MSTLPTIGELREIPAGVKVWSIALQSTIIFEDPRIVRVTSTIYGSPDYFYGILQNSVGDIRNGDVGLKYSETIPGKIKGTSLFYMDFKYDNNIIGLLGSIFRIRKR